MFSRAFPQVLRSAYRSPSTRISQCQNPLPPPLFLRASQRQWPQARHLTTRESAKKLFRQHPFSVSLASFFILTGAASLLYTGYIYQTYIIGDFRKYPEPVAIKLRRALFYTNIELNPKKAVEYYRQALRVAAEVGMDQFSDEIIGIKIQLAALMEKVHHYQKAIDVLEIVRADCLKYVDTISKLDGRAGDRTRVLGKTVGISVKLGELYANEYVGDPEAAEKSLVEGVETSLRELQRRESEGVKEGEGPWMSHEEIGGALESLASHYEQQSKHYLSAPLYLRILSLHPESTCHAIVIMNNLAASIAQQVPPPSPSSPPPSRAALVDNARAWARKSLEVAAAVKPPERTEECDIGCAVATHNLAEFAEMDGDLTEARRRYEEAKGLSRAIGFGEGVERADEGLRRIGSVGG